MVPVGEERARTCKRGSTALRSASGISRKTGPSKHMPPGLKIPQAFAIFWAVTMSICLVNYLEENKKGRETYCHQ
jgi:hypothetical protein